MAGQIGRQRLAICRRDRLRSMHENRSGCPGPVSARAAQAGVRGAGAREPPTTGNPSASGDFVPLWGLVVRLVYAPRRIDCKSCGTPTIERVPWASGKRRLCDVLRLFLAQWPRRLSRAEVAETFSVSWADVYGSVRWVVGYGSARNERLKLPSLLDLQDLGAKGGTKI